ncbi:phosphoglycerate kinase [Mycoplasmoides fastidiosum]|uniref:phosphoglycerate kinase n=1 Tax=Mycoplasmoides fastidiosum TaxID=92758 RepID=UPI0027D90497|nr:phosphoglycerate kinase [Mycoplasmoides fastidiosum]
MYNKKTIRDLNLDQQTVLVRLDLNVPLKDGVVGDDTRIVQSLPTLQYLIEHKCKIIVLSHLSRIKSLEDKLSGKKSLAPVAARMGELLKQPVRFLAANTGTAVTEAVQNLDLGEVLVLENTRYQDVNDQGDVVKLESKNDPKLAQFWASLAPIYVNDAFGTAHRAHASNVGIASNVTQSAIGFLIEQELLNLARACDQFERPLVAVLGGAKISDKLKVIERIVQKADYVLIGGGMAYTFKKANNQAIGKSMLDQSMVDKCRELMQTYGEKLVIPIDTHAAPSFADLPGKVLVANASAAEWGDWIGLDIGPDSITKFNNILDQAKTVVWNGPMGVFEFSHYEAGTRAIANKIQEITAKNHAFTLIGGGDSAAAYQQFNHGQGVSFISTGGGASLTYMEEENLPGISAIADK